MEFVNYIYFLELDFYIENFYGISDMITYISIFLTIIFGIWGTYVTIKNRYFVQITFLIRKRINLFDTIVKEMTDLSINYKGSPIKPNLIFIEGFIANTGKKDIQSSMIERPLSLTLAEDFKWIEAKIISGNNAIEAKIDISNQQNLLINSGLLKIGEFIKFQALLETPTSEYNKPPNIIINHRIADLHININPSYLKSEIKKSAMATLFFIAIASWLFSFYSTYDLFKNYSNLTVGSLIYSVQTTDNMIKVKAKALRNGKIMLEGINNNYNKIIFPNEFLSKIKQIEPEPAIFSFYFALTLTIIMMILFFISALLSTYKGIKLAYYYMIQKRLGFLTSDYF